MNIQQRSAKSPSPAKDPCPCEFISTDPVSWRVTLIQRARKLIKSTIWTPLTWALDRLGLGLHTIQVLCIDRSADKGKGRVLILISDEVEGGFSPVQGLRQSQRLIPPWSYLDPDARADAYAELREEATTRPPSLDRFRLVRRYREGTWRGRYTGQFACSVFVIDCTMDEIPLRGENGEGTPCWARIEDAVAWINSPILTPILNGVPVEIGDFERPSGVARMGLACVRT